MRQFRSCLLCLLVLVVYVSVGVGAEPTGTIAGLVTDPSGAAVVGADVLVRNSLTGLTRSTKTDAEGGFLFPLMPVGSYEVSVVMPGLRRFDQKGITVLVNGVANIPVGLVLGSV